MATVVLEEQEHRPVPALDRFTLTAPRAGLVLEPQLAPRVRRVVPRAVLFARALLRCPAAAEIRRAVEGGLTRPLP